MPAGILDAVRAEIEGHIVDLSQAFNGYNTIFGKMMSPCLDIDRLGDLAVGRCLFSLI